MSEYGMFYHLYPWEPEFLLWTKVFTDETQKVKTVVLNLNWKHLYGRRKYLVYYLPVYLSTYPHTPICIFYYLLPRNNEDTVVISTPSA